MNGVVLLLVGSLLGPVPAGRPRGVVGPGGVPGAAEGESGGSGGSVDYARSLGSKKLDQATLDAEGYGAKKAFHRDDDGLRITLAPGDEETGWKTPPQLHIGGDFAISAGLVIRKLPKPAQEDGAAVGLAIATQDVNQPDVALVRLREPGGADVYRSVERETLQQANQAQMPMMRFGPMMQPGGKPPKPPRRTFPAEGDAVRLELRREGGTVRYQVLDAKTGRPRYLGQVELGTNDVSALKLFATNRNGAEAVDVLWRDLAIHADRIGGLGTVVRTVFDEVVYAEPTSIEDGRLILGGQPRTPPPAPPKPPEKKGTPEKKESQGGKPAVAKQADPSNEENPPAFATPPPAESSKSESPPKAAAKTAKEKEGEARPAAAEPKVGPPKSQMASPPKPPAGQEPKARLPLDELESIRFERTPSMSARFMGQPNLDYTGPNPGAKKDDPAAKAEAKKPDAGAEAKKPDAGADALAPPPGTTVMKTPRVNPEKNGIRDVHLALSGLHASKIKQVTVNCQAEGGPTGWRLDTADSKDAPLVVHRSGTEPWADLYLEPPPGDAHDKPFQVAVIFEDGQNGNAVAKADGHTDPKLAVDPKAPTSTPPGATVYLADDEKLHGNVDSIGQESLRLTTPWQDHLDIPLTRIVGLHFSLLERKEAPDAFAKRLKARGPEDLLLAQSKDGEVVAIPGALEGSEGDKLRFSYQGRTRTLPLKQVEGLVMAARPDSPTTEEPGTRFSLPGGLAVAGRWKDLDTATWKVETPWGQDLKLPAADIQGVKFRGGKMTYLSDLKPSKVEEAPFFGRKLPWRHDVNLLGEPLKMDGRTYDRGVAVHSRCALTYDLNGRYNTFEALVGFDEASKGKGRVDCRVFADGKELFANPDLRADGPPVPIKVPVAGAEQLRILVDFGRGEDTGDRVIWANARLFRRPPAGTAAAATPNPPGNPPTGDADAAGRS